jgi:hypothetical protein
MAANGWYVPVSFLQENVLAKIPQILHEHINTAYPANVCLIGTVLPNGFAQITPRGSTMVFDDEHIALWERGKGTTTENLTDGTPVTIFMRKPALREAGILPKGGILRLYGRAKIHNPDRFMKRSGTVSSRRRRRAIRKRRAMPSSLRSREPRICRVSR